MEINRSGDGVEIRSGEELIRIEPWGPDSVRVRAALGGIDPDLPGALDLPAAAASSVIDVGPDSVSLTNGAMTVVAANESGDWDSCVVLRFCRSDTGEELLAERRAHNWWPGPRVFTGDGSGRFRLEQHFRAYDDERLYGLGQRTHGRLDQKGMTLDLVQRNAEVSIPFVLSSRGYGLLWNNPALGHVELATNRTRWVANAARQIDYWITAGAPAAILARYADTTGHAPLLPEWATGFWQSKLRYRTQEELLEVAREYRRRAIPVSVIVADFFHWRAMGDWCFDPAEWPDPAAMVAELRAMGTRLMVSIWPLVGPLSENHERMADAGLLVASDEGSTYLAEFPEKPFGRSMPMSLYDATNPAGRAFIWSEACRNYLGKGIDVWWLDACEPELRELNAAGLRLHLGRGDEVLNVYPREHARAFFEGMREAGVEDVVLLCRSAWAGSQRYGAAVWSGDIPATWESLSQQVRAGLNIALSGIPWWTTDIGGFHGGDPDDDDYRELVVRWFQYGLFCPLLRLHGNRLPRAAFRPEMTGGPNEIWSYGDEAYESIRAVLDLRERMRPYIGDQMRVAHETGLPPMRPLFVDFPNDRQSWEVEDEFMFGPSVLVAPILRSGARSRDVYLPSGRWADAWSGVEVQGPRTLTVDAPIDRIPVFLCGPSPFVRR